MVYLVSLFSWAGIKEQVKQYMQLLVCLIEASLLKVMHMNGGKTTNQIIFKKEDAGINLNTYV